MNAPSESPSDPTGRVAGDDLRRCWLAVLAHAPRELLARHAGALSGHDFTRLRAPEVGLAMVRARIGNTGDRFNLGDATVTRCVVRHRGVGGIATAGVGYVLGRDEERAEWVARLDAMLQQPEHHDALLRDVIAPLAAATAQRRADDAARAAATKVRFETLSASAAA